MAEKRPDRIAGPNHDEFWAWCGKGELRLQQCGSCGEMAWPPVTTCESCAGEQFDWKKMSGRGRIASWCSFERDYYNGLFPMPWDTIVVELEEGPLFLSNPSGFSCADVTIGMSVELTFEECEDSSGNFRLPVFRLPVS